MSEVERERLVVLRSVQQGLRMQVERLRQDQRLGHVHDIAGSQHAAGKVDRRDGIALHHVVHRHPAQRDLKGRLRNADIAIKDGDEPDGMQDLGAEAGQKFSSSSTRNSMVPAFT